VVAYDGTRLGLPHWDGVTNQVRHYKVSRYLLEHWTPVVRSHGFLLMLRDDLARGRRVGLPDLAEPVDTGPFWGGVPTCAWGYAADLLRSRPAGTRTRLTVSPPRDARQLAVKGWAWRGSAEQRVVRVVVAVGGTVVGDLPTVGPRAELLARTYGPQGLSAGFGGTVTTRLRGEAQVFAVLANGEVRPVGEPVDHPPARLDLGRGERARVYRAPVTGEIEKRSTRTVALSRVRLPAGAGKAALATFAAGAGAIGPAEVTVYADEAAGPVSSISFRARQGTRSVAVPVGSCLQWRGFGRTMWLAQHGGRTIDSVVLSDVAD
jgi:hypothetical protein